MKKLSTLLLLAAVALAGCNETDPVQTVDWYKTNASERATMLAKCKANPGELAASPNCINANRAETAVDGAKRAASTSSPCKALNWEGNENDCNHKRFHRNRAND